MFSCLELDAVMRKSIQSELLPRSVPAKRRPVPVSSTLCPTHVPPNLARHLDEDLLVDILHTWERLMPLGVDRTRWIVTRVEQARDVTKGALRLDRVAVGMAERFIDDLLPVAERIVGWSRLLRGPGERDAGVDGWTTSCERGVEDSEEVGGQEGLLVGEGGQQRHDGRKEQRRGEEMHLS